MTASAALLLASCASAPETPALQVGDVVQMSKAEIAPGIIIARIRAGRLESEDLTPAQIIKLHQEGLDPQVLSALVLASAGQTPPPYAPPAERPAAPETERAEEGEP